MSLIATVHGGKSFGRETFHPMMEPPPSFRLDDPAAEHDRLKAMGR